MIERGTETGPECRGLWNTSVVIDATGEVAATYRKIHRFGFGEGEPILLEAGEDNVVADLAGINAGLAVCYDLRFPEHFRTLVAMGAEAFIVPASWPAARMASETLRGSSSPDWRSCARAVDRSVAISPPSQ